MRDEDDATLVEAARAGDKGALAALLARHWPLLRGVCRRMLGAAGGEEDAAQEAALQAMLTLDRLRDADRFGSWLAGIGLNVCRRMLRRRARDEWSLEAVVGGRLGAEPVDRESTPAERAEAAELATRVRGAVAALPTGQRAAVALVYLGGLTQAETAAQLGIEVGAVKTRLHKARATLRRELWDEGKEAAMGTAVEAGMVEVRVADVRRGPSEDGHAVHAAVVLEEVGGTRRLPIWVGDFEATAIALQIEGVATPRPQVYAFAASVLGAAGGRLREVRVDRLVEEVFYAVAVVEGPGGATEVDARPSDAVNLALLAGAPLRVAREVFERIAVEPAGLKGAARVGTGEDAATIAAAALAEWASHAASSAAAGSGAEPEPASGPVA